MRRASVAMLKARLSEFLRAVKTGEEIIVTERGKPVARLAPLESREGLDAHLRKLVKAGLARPPVAELPRDFWNLPRPKDPTGLSLRAILEEREAGTAGRRQVERG